MIDLVIGAAIGYDRSQVRPFLKSLRLNGYEGRIVLFANGGGAEEAKDWNVEVLPCQTVNTVPHAERFYWIKDYLIGAQCDGVLCADVRDIFFQSDISDLPSEGVHAYEEDDCMTIKSCPYNSEWVNIGYGSDVLHQIGDRPISCVGTICGDHEAVLSHLIKLVDELKRLQPKTHKPQDQSCHNYIITRGGVTVWNNEQGAIYTVGYIPYGTVATKGDFVINKAGNMPSVIHQWDRHPNLVELVERKYSC